MGFSPSGFAADGLKPILHFVQVIFAQILKHNLLPSRGNSQKEQDLLTVGVNRGGLKKQTTKMVGLFFVILIGLCRAPTGDKTVGHQRHQRTADRG